MKVVLINRWTGSHKGGTETHVKELARGLAQRGHTVTVLTTRGDEFASDRFEDIKVIFVRPTLGESYFSRRAARLRAVFFLAKASVKLMHLLLTEAKPDIISVHYAVEAYLARMIRGLSGIPYAFVFEGYTDWEAKVAKNADVRIAISRDIANKCRERWGYEPHVIPPVMDLPLVPPCASNRTNHGRRFRILTVCQLVPRKDIATLLRAIRIVLDSGVNVEAVIVGDGEERKRLEELRSELALEKSVVLRGVIEREELLLQYAQADVFALPSRYEGFGIVLVEAMAAGLPLISTNCSAIPEVVGHAGILVPPGMPAQLAEAITAVASSSELREKLSQRSKQRAREFDPDVVLTKYEDAFQITIDSLAPASVPGACVRM